MYHVLTGTNVEELGKLVEKMLGCGWELAGGVCYGPHGYHQALFKKKPLKETRSKTRPLPIGRSDNPQ